MKRNPFLSPHSNNVKSITAPTICALIIYEYFLSDVLKWTCTTKQALTTVNTQAKEKRHTTNKKFTIFLAKGTFSTNNWNPSRILFIENCRWKMENVFLYFVIGKNINVSGDKELRHKFSFWFLFFSPKVHKLFPLISSEI